MGCSLLYCTIFIYLKSDTFVASQNVAIIVRGVW